MLALPNAVFMFKTIDMLLEKFLAPSKIIFLHFANMLVSFLLTIGDITIKSVGLHFNNEHFKSFFVQLTPDFPYHRDQKL